MIIDEFLCLSFLLSKKDWHLKKQNKYCICNLINSEHYQRCLVANLCPKSDNNILLYNNNIIYCYYHFCCSSLVLFKVSASVVARARPLFCLSPQSVCAVTCCARGFGVIFSSILIDGGINIDTGFRILFFWGVLCIGCMLWLFLWLLQ